MNKILSRELREVAIEATLKQEIKRSLPDKEEE